MQVGNLHPTYNITQVINGKMENRKMKWDDMKKFASLCDVERNGEVKTTDTENIYKCRTVQQAE